MERRELRDQTTENSTVDEAKEDSSMGELENPSKKFD